MPRRIEPEILDELPPQDPRALGSRRDLRRINAWMMQAGIMARLLRRYGPTPPRTIIELGCGDGTFMLGLARRLAPSWPGVTVELVDRQDIVSPETRSRFGALGWHAEPVVADASDALQGRREASGIVTANLFLHHLHDDALMRLFAATAVSATFVAACEPRRSAMALAGSRLVGLIGCNDVSRHDAVASVRAGFAGDELSTAWRRGAEAGAAWSLEEGRAGLFTHTFLARRVTAEAA